jgi:cyclopropane-fatty-acyl-phospholipid synthase
MFTRRTLDQWRRQWRGPAVRLTGRGLDLILGEGTPQVELVVHRLPSMSRFWQGPSMVFGEAYMRGDVEVRGPLMDLLKGFHLTRPRVPTSWHHRAIERFRGIPRPASVSQATANARHHYDVGNAFYELWLDPSLTYSCAYFLREEDGLAAAQVQKLELLCRKVRLEQDQTLLDIGCGWGSLLFYAAEHHGVRATGVTPSAEQTRHIEARAAKLGVTDRVQVIQGDWRKVQGRFDRVVSVGMFEHVGPKQYAVFFRKWRDLLAPGGLSLLHTIGRMSPLRMDPWIVKYIFPGGYLPTLGQIADHAGAAELRIVDVENLGQHYARTLDHWSRNFHTARDRVVKMYDEVFARMWWLYLQGAEAAFHWGNLQLWQVVLARSQEPAPWPLDREVQMSRFRNPDAVSADFMNGQESMLRRRNTATASMT